VRCLDAGVADGLGGGLLLEVRLLSISIKLTLDPIPILDASTLSSLRQVLMLGTLAVGLLLDVLLEL